MCRNLSTILLLGSAISQAISRTPSTLDPELEKRIFGVTSGKGNAGIIGPILDYLSMTLSALLAIPELLLCDQVITLVCIKALYNVTQPVKAAPGNQLGIFEDLGDIYSQDDLNLVFLAFAEYVTGLNLQIMFAHIFRHIPQGTGPKLEAVDGTQAPVSVANAGPESDLGLWRQRCCWPSG
jgi:tripeptidyl-peptidase-1